MRVGDDFPAVVTMAKATQTADNELVYFIKSGNFLKIGYTTNLDSRLKAHQTSNPDFELLYTIPGQKFDESAFHERFKKFRSIQKTEWFVIESELVQFVEDLRAASQAQEAVATVLRALIDGRKAKSSRTITIANVCSIVNGITAANPATSPKEAFKQAFALLTETQEKLDDHYGITEAE